MSTPLQYYFFLDRDWLNLILASERHTFLVYTIKLIIEGGRIDNKVKLAVPQESLSPFEVGDVKFFFIGSLSQFFLAFQSARIIEQKSAALSAGSSSIVSTL